MSPIFTQVYSDRKVTNYTYYYKNNIHTWTGVARRKRRRFSSDSPGKTQHISSWVMCFIMAIKYTITSIAGTPVLHKQIHSGQYLHLSNFTRLVVCNVYEMESFTEVGFLHKLYRMFITKCTIQKMKWNNYFIYYGTVH